MFQAFGRHFLRGLLFVAPIAATVYVVYALARALDGWMKLEALLGRRAPGAGLVLTVALTTLIGFLASTLSARWLLGVVDRFMSRLPVARLIYTSIRDLVHAFVGDNRRFNRPVLLSVTNDAVGAGAAAIGFLTREDLTELGLPAHAAVYLPQSYNFAGQLLIVPRERLRALPIGGASAMTLIVSGGVSGEAIAPQASSGP